VSSPQDSVDALFDDDERFGTTYAAVIARGNAVRAERYGGALPNFGKPDEPVSADTPLLSWSIAKSVLHAAVGVVVREGRLDIHAPANVPEWSAPGDPRRAITVDHLLTMRDGLAFAEDYSGSDGSNVIEMLFGSGQHDVAHYAAERPLAHAPGTVFNYSSGSANLVARILGELVGDIQRFMREAVFDPIGMTSATIRTDEAGTFVASSYAYATARDWVRFGQCYLHGGEGVVTPDWVREGTTERSIDPDSAIPYGAEWWVLPGCDRHPPAFFADGFEGQRVVVCPDRDLVVVRFGKSTDDQCIAMMKWCSDVLAADVGS
jgi:CubicO group peptidase (beta-lactamase class C family)